MRCSSPRSAVACRLVLWVAAPVAALGLVLCALALPACGRPKPLAMAPAAPDDPSRFPHARHATLTCEPCHQGDARPGKDDHKPCDDGQCHRADFLRQPGRVCTVCHVAVQLGEDGPRAPLVPFPRTAGLRALPSRFSHALHLDAARLENAVGFHLACSDCHPADDAGAPQSAGHPACARCHAEEAALPKGPAMKQCASCHGDLPARPRKLAQVVTGDLHFSHANHRADRTGAAISCTACHPSSVASTAHDDHRPPTVTSCVPCHDDSRRVPSGQRMRVCETCHRDKRSSLWAIAPRSHLPGTERPLDHTLAFRTDHGDAAAREAARCATCHSEMSGSPRDACDECHRVTAPADHRLSWREVDHGVEAAASAERCALCHTADSCTACHRQVPRSHLPTSEFRFQHGLAARVNVRACLACHQPELDCAGAGCHTAGAVGGP